MLETKGIKEYVKIQNVKNFKRDGMGKTSHCAVIFYAQFMLKIE